MRLPLILAALLLVPASLRAETPSNAGAAPLWSIGTGVSLFNTRLGLGQLSSTVSVPVTLGLSAERRIAPQLWLALQLDGGYQSTSSEEPASGGATTTRDESASLLSAAVGGRYVFNPGGVVEVSGVLSVGVAYLSDTDERSNQVLGSTVSTTTEGSDLAFRTNIGVAFERQLGKNLALRFATTIVHLTYVSSTSETSNSANSSVVVKDEESSILAGFSFQPQIGLLLQF
ncbi:MAG: hypothetical protein ACOX6T_19845 [Myxococcales bacterium]|jgi:hypothetical protein